MRGTNVQNAGVTNVVNTRMMQWGMGHLRGSAGIGVGRLGFSFLRVFLSGSHCLDDSEVFLSFQKLGRCCVGSGAQSRGRSWVYCAHRTRVDHVVACVAHTIWESCVSQTFVVLCVYSAHVAHMVDLNGTYVERMCSVCARLHMSLPLCAA
eukprot:5022947-Pyramimonas_sp.AAC.1